MSARVEIDQQWIDEQMAHFPLGSADGIVAMMRAFDRTRRTQQAADIRKRGEAA